MGARLCVDACWVSSCLLSAASELTRRGPTGGPGELPPRTLTGLKHAFAHVRESVLTRVWRQRGGEGAARGPGWYRADITRRQNPHPPSRGCLIQRRSAAELRLSQPLCLETDVRPNRKRQPVKSSESQMCQKTPQDLISATCSKRAAAIAFLTAKVCTISAALRHTF